MQYQNTHVACPGNCTIKTVAVSSLHECQSQCNATGGCKAVQIDHANKSCDVLREDAPGAPDPARDTYVRVPGSIRWDWTGSYNAAPPLCPDEPNDVCPKYVNSWEPNRTSKGAEVFPYTECGDWQGAARTNHSHDRVPYLPNLIAGFDPRPVGALVALITCVTSLLPHTWMP